MAIFLKSIVRNAIIIENTTMHTFFKSNSEVLPFRTIRTISIRKLGLCSKKWIQSANNKLHKMFSHFFMFSSLLPLLLNFWHTILTFSILFELFQHLLIFSYPQFLVFRQSEERKLFLFRLTGTMKWIRNEVFSKA